MRYDESQRESDLPQENEAKIVDMVHEGGAQMKATLLAFWYF